MDLETDIQKEAEKVLEELTRALGDVEMEETYYVVEEINVTRPDANPGLDETTKDIIKKNSHGLDENGNFIMEVGKWTG